MEQQRQATWSKINGWLQELGPQEQAGQQQQQQQWQQQEQGQGHASQTWQQQGLEMAGIAASGQDTQWQQTVGDGEGGCGGETEEGDVLEWLEQAEAELSMMEGL